jgi:Zinc-binding dehydrogenase
MIAAGKLKVRISMTYPLSEAPQAHRDLEGRKTIPAPGTKYRRAYSLMVQNGPERHPFGGTFGGTHSVA